MLALAMIQGHYLNRQPYLINYRFVLHSSSMKGSILLGAKACLRLAIKALCDRDHRLQYHRTKWAPTRVWHAAAAKFHTQSIQHTQSQRPFLYSRRVASRIDSPLSRLTSSTKKNVSLGNSYAVQLSRFLHHGRCAQTSSLSQRDSQQQQLPISKSAARTNVELVDGKTLLLHCGVGCRTLHVMWLRDHCRCPSCYNHTTFQKETWLNPFDRDKFRPIEISLQDRDKSLVVDWGDGHKSEFSVQWLMENSYSSVGSSPAAVVERLLWDGDCIRSQRRPSVPYASLLNTEEGLRQTLHNLVQYGFTFVDEVPPCVEATQTASERVAPVQQTFYGGMFTFTSDASRSDTAYSSGSLGAHTDTTYLETPAGIQVFHCLQHDGEGGETLMVDGFHAVDRLHKTHPQALRCLSRHAVSHEYREDEAPTHPGGTSLIHQLYTQAPVLRLHPTTGHTLQLRFNPYDRAPLNTVPHDELEEFYESYHLLSQAITDPKSEHWVKLTPGTMVLVDNWRVLHGRASFTGKRVMCGCYLRRDEFVSHLRVLGLA